MTTTNRFFFKRTIATLLTLTLIVGCFAANSVSVSAASALPLPYADINRDGAANTKDVMTVYAVVSTGDDSSLTMEQRLCADTDGDGTLSMKDVMKLFRVASAKDTPESAAPAPSALELEVFRLVNIEREKAGVTPLEYAYDIQLFSDIRAEECTGYFSHTRPNGQSCFSVYDEYQSPYFVGGENIAMYQRSPEEVVADWMASPGHRQNMLNPNYRTMGVGCYEIPGYSGYYTWTQFFNF